MSGQTVIVIADKQWSVAVASTLVEVATGLSGVESIPAGTGMLFDLGYDHQTIQIDMSRMLFPLDIVFINSTQGMVGVMHNVQPGETDIRFENVNLPGARWFLEINGGEAEEINVGDNVVIQGSTAPAQIDLTGLLNYVVIMMMVIFMGRMAIRAVSPPKPKPVLYGPRGELLPQTATIEGGDVIPPQYRHLVDPLPVPEFALSVEYLPAVELEPGETKTDALLRKLKDGVQRIQTSPEFRNYLIAMSRFHNYSWNNQLLIMMQRPDATHVAGFNTWKELGRWVRKGETGIAVFAPSFRAADVTWVRHADGKRWRIQRLGEEWGIYEEDHLVGRYKAKRAAERQLRMWGATEERVAEAEPRFIVVHVFDIAQTEGEPLPEFEVPVLTSEVNEELFARLRALMKQRGVTVSFESRPHLDPATKGQYLAPNEIWVRPEEPPAQQLKTLLHEVAHYYSEGVFRIPRRDAETIAESAAFVVGAHHGFDTGVRSFPYVALWAQDEKVLAENLGAIQRVAKTILEELGGAGEKEGFSPQAMPSVRVMPKLPPEAYRDVLFFEYIRDLVKLGETITDEEARVMWQAWKKRQGPPYLAQTTPRTELRFADRPMTATADTLRGWLRAETARPIQTAGWYGAEGYKPRLYVIGETIYQIEWGPAKKHYLLPASEEDMAHDTKERLREEGVEIGPPGKPPPGKPTRADVTVGARQKLGVWITDTRTGATLAEWADKDARGLFEEGLLRGRVPVSVWEAPDSELTESALSYAESVGLLAKGSPITHLPQTEKGEYSWLIIDPETGEIIIKTGFTVVSKARRSARDYAVRRAKYVGEYPVKLRIYDRDPNIGELDVGIIFEGRILIPEGRIVESKGEAPAVVPTEPRRPRPGKEELQYLPDSPEFLTQTIDATGYREKIDTTFQEAIRRAKGTK